MGVDSGLPDFRGQEGFWRAYPPMKQLNLSFYDLARPEWFRKDPCLAWGFYGHRAELYRKTIPHAGFTKLLQLANKMKHGYFVVTSNVDGQFQKAGFDKDRILEVHGSILHLQCIDCKGKIVPLPDSYHFDIDESTFRVRSSETLPKCPVGCGKLARPNVLLFGDWDWIGSQSETQFDLFENWLNTLDQEKVSLCIIELGAGKAVPTIRHQTETLFQRFQNSFVLRINPRESDFPPHCRSDPKKKENAISLPLPALECLEKLGL
eukprot:TRINITY_DN2721_c0_g1_i1.p1 TRINITY_DN2721_c0_g1~~TRINITY_DN2721_c0_g1_i1.p1  ORF type:complete len:296 (-),score=71.01 TRINITY_DN2721_c0_g1_i1:115-906(-)